MAQLRQGRLLVTVLDKSSSDAGRMFGGAGILA